MMATKEQTIGRLLTQITAARVMVAEARKIVQVLSLQHGQDCADISVCGLKFPLTALDRHYAPAVVPGRQALLAQCLKIAQENCIVRAGELEGLEHKLRRVVNNTTDGAA